MRNSQLDNAWVAVQVRTMHEKLAAEHLLIQGYEVSCPCNCGEQILLPLAFVNPGRFFRDTCFAAIRFDIISVFFRHPA